MEPNSMAYSADNTPPGSPTAVVPAAAFWCQEYDFAVAFHSSTASLPNLRNADSLSIHLPRYSIFDDDSDFAYDDGDENLENGSSFPAYNPNDLHIRNGDSEYEYDSDSDSDSDHDLVEDVDVVGNAEDVSRQGPASRSLIESIPSVEITEAFIGSTTSTPDSPPSCSVCTEEFVLGTEVKRLPCNHIYHGDCIVMWLLRSNSCPLCRSRMSLVPGDDSIRSMDGRRRRRIRITVVVPFENFREEEVEEYEMLC